MQLRIFSRERDHNRFGGHSLLRDAEGVYKTVSQVGKKAAFLKQSKLYFFGKTRTAPTPCKVLISLSVVIVGFSRNGDCSIHSAKMMHSSCFVTRLGRLACVFSISV